MKRSSFDDRVHLETTDILQNGASVNPMSEIMRKLGVTEYTAYMCKRKTSTATARALIKFKYSDPDATLADVNSFIVDAVVAYTKYSNPNDPVPDTELKKAIDSQQRITSVISLCESMETADTSMLMRGEPETVWPCWSRRDASTMTDYLVPVTATLLGNVEDGHEITGSIVLLGYKIGEPVYQVTMALPTEEFVYTPCTSDAGNSPFATHRKKWSISNKSIVEAQLKWKSFVASIPSYPSHKYSGSGIVSSAYNGYDGCKRLMAFLKILRWLNCKLPIEIFSFRGELTSYQILELTEISGVTSVIIDDKESLANRRRSRFAIKLLAILKSTFEHVLWLDSDNIPIRDPTYLFDLPQYKRSTAIFWPDFWFTSIDNPIWRILNIPCRIQDYEQESGQILINKKSTWKPLNMALYMTTDKLFQTLLYGDKDTFRLSWQALNVSFYFIRKYLAIGGFEYIRKGKQHNRLSNTSLRFCGHTMIQHDPNGTILFVHMNLLKHYPYMKFPHNLRYPQLLNTSNPWRIIRQYSETKPHLRAIIESRDGFTCTDLSTAEREYYSSIVDVDYHSVVSANLTAKYFEFRNISYQLFPEPSAIQVIDRN
ncbi:unnamed protein product [Adineta steineri]|uniref:Uncharacterized protein n=1 Tax=Adineta steineri TaxID=433720 RepID=A0A818THC7_9BILA|nr:unnamed protein product [Adineta steineri]CAF3677648.1 unnamed protein product [Adineta steineri]